MSVFFGSSASWRWKDALAGNSIVSVSPSSSAGRASPSTVEIGIDFSATAGTIVRCHASCSWAMSMTGGDGGEDAEAEGPAGEERILELMKETFDAREREQE